MTGLARIWLAVAGLASGIAAGGVLGIGGGLLAAMAGATGLSLRRRPIAASAALVCLAAGAGATSTVIRDARVRPLAALSRHVPNCAIEGAVAEQIGGLGTLVELESVDCGPAGRLHHAGTAAADLPDASPGASVRAEAWLVPLGDDEFDTARRRLGAAAELEVRTVQVGPVRPLAAHLAERVRDGLRRATEGLAPDRSALLRGLAVGDTGGMTAATEDALRRAGLSHLVAVSGSNLAIVLGSVAFAARRLTLRIRLVLGAIALGSFVVVVGPEPSVLRAAAMGGIGLAALGLGRRAGPLHALGLAVILVLGARPGLLYSVGLHLSVAATAGIVLWSGVLAERWPRLPAPIAVPLAVTVAAQVAVAPLLVLAFGELSIVAPVANVLAVPAVPFATVVALLAGLVSTIHAGSGAMLAAVASPAAGWILGVGRCVGGTPWASPTLTPGFGWVLAVLVAGAAAITLRNGIGGARRAAFDAGR